MGSGHYLLGAPGAAGIMLFRAARQQRWRILAIAELSFAELLP